MQKKIISLLLAGLMAVAVVIPVIAQSAHAKTYKTVYTYRISPLDELIIQEKADELLSALQKKDDSYEAFFPAYMIAKYTQRTLWNMVEQTMYQTAPFISGQYRISQFSVKYTETPTSCGYILDKQLTDSQMRQTELVARDMVSDLKNKVIPEKDKLHEIYDRLNNTMVYDDNLEQKDAAGNVIKVNELAETAYGALIEHKAVCCGAAMAMSLLCYYAGIKNISMVQGYLNYKGDFGDHVWNTYFDGKDTYIIDTVNHQFMEERPKDFTYTPNRTDANTFNFTF